MTKRVKPLMNREKKTAPTMDVTRTAVFHSRMILKAHQARKRSLED